MPDQPNVTDEEVDSRDAFAHPDQRGVVGMVRDQIRLDEADRLLVEQHEVVIGRLLALDRREIVLDDLLVGLVVAPPAANMWPLKPLVHQAQVV